jgi:hypothetical protein
MLIQIASDLHLEHYVVDFLNVINGTDQDNEAPETSSQRENSFWLEKDILHPNAPTLALLGDISNCTYAEGRSILESFLKFYSPSFDNILFLAGNHEYYCMSHVVGGHKIVDAVDITTVDSYLSSLSQKFSNFQYLNLTRVDIDGVAILGCTLWSAIPDTNPRIQIMVESFLNDYRQIYVMDEEQYEYRVISGDDTNAWFGQQVQWIQKELSKIEQDEPNTPVIVLTHHGPMLKGCSHPRYENQKPPELFRRHGFVSDLLPLLQGFPNLKAWFYGHTHYNNTRVLDNGVLVSSNQRGYANHVLPDYKPGDVYEVNVTSKRRKVEVDNPAPEYADSRKESRD